MISAIKRAIEYCCVNDTLTATTKKKDSKTEESKEQAADVHESDAVEVAGL